MSSTTSFPWIRFGAGALSLIIIVVFWGPLKNWFSPRTGEKSSVVGSPLANDHSKHSGTGFEEYAFSDTGLKSLRDVFSAYEVSRNALANDETQVIAAASEKIQKSIAELLADEGDIYPPRVRSVLEQTAETAKALVKKSAVEARGPFGELSEALFYLALGDSRLQEGWFTYQCPMTNGFGKWFQRTENLENPYMGQKMLGCGSASDWAIQPEQGNPISETSESEVAYWTCSMHHSVRHNDSGTCPICSMDLIPVTKEDLRTGDVIVDSLRRQRIGVRTQVATRRELTRSIRAVGRVIYDESRLYDVRSRVDGWVEELRVSKTGDAVRQGTVLLKFYSPQLLATQQELLAVPKQSLLAKSARERLRLLGMSSREIQQILVQGIPSERVSLRAPRAGVITKKNLNQGAHVRVGQLLYQIADLSRVWLEVDVFEQDLSHVAVGQSLRIELPHANSQKLSGEVAYVYPYLEGSSRAGKLRVELENPTGILRPGMFANVFLDVPLGEHLAIPTEGILVTGPRQLVFVDKGEGRLHPVEVTVGAKTSQWTVIKSGISDGDVVVSSGAFLIAAESRIHSATKYWGGH